MLHKDESPQKQWVQMLREWTMWIATVLIKFLVNFYLKCLGPQHYNGESHWLWKLTMHAFEWISLWRKTGKSAHLAQIDVQQRHLRFGRCHVDYGQNTYIKPSVWTFTLDTNNVLLYAPSSSKSREARARGSSVLTAWPEHCLQMPFLRALMVPGTVHPTQKACCRSNLCLFSQYEPLRRCHETGGYLEGSTDFRVAGCDKDGKWSLRILSMISSSRVYIHIRELPRLSTSSPSYQFYCVFCFVFWTTVITWTKDWKQQENASFWGSTHLPWEKIWMGRLKYQIDVDFMNPCFLNWVFSSIMKQTVW